MDHSAVEELLSFPPSSYRKGDYIIHQGTPAVNVYFLSAGAAERTAVLANGEEMIYDIRRADQTVQCLLGALTFYKAKKIHGTNFRAASSCTCHRINEAAFMDFLNRNPAILHDLIGLAINSYHFLNVNFRSKQKGMAPAQVAMWLLNNSTENCEKLCYMPVYNTTQLARHLGLSRPTVSRILHAFVKADYLRSEGDILVVTDLAALQACADGRLPIKY